MHEQREQTRDHCPPLDQAALPLPVLVRLKRLQVRLRRDHIGGADDGALTLREWRALEFYRWRTPVARERQTVAALDELPAITAVLIEGPVDVQAVRRYVHQPSGTDDTSAFPNIIFRGWCKRGGERWQVDWCPWSPEMFVEWFGARAAGRLQLLRWEFRRGVYKEDHERWIPST